MKLLDKNRFASAFQTMCEIFDKKNTKIMLAGYFKTLESFSIDQVEKAVSTAIGSCKFFPKPVELIEFITGGQSQIASNAQIEVDKILCHFRQYGSTRHPELSDPISKHLMSNRWVYGNWASSILESEIKWWQKEFIEAYNAYSASDVKPEIEYHDNVAGLIEGIG